MNKNILAIAIAAAVAAPSAFAAATVYGQAHMGVASQSGMAADTKSASMDANSDTENNFNVVSNSSRVGIKGSEDLGGGLKALYQMEMSVNMDNGAGGLGGTLRDTFVGLGGGFGTALIGRMDSPIKRVGRKYDLFGDQIGNARNLTGSGVFTTADGAYAASRTSSNLVGGLVDGRHSNVIAYATPKMGGFDALIAYVPGAAYDAEKNSATKKQGDAFSASLNFAAGAFDAGFGYIRIATKGVESGSYTGGVADSTATFDHDSNPVTADIKVTTLGTKGTAGTYAKDFEAFRLGGSYTFGAAKIVATYMNDNTAQLVGSKGTRDVFGLGGSYKVTSAGTVKAQYYVAGDMGRDMDKTGASLINVGYDHAMSKNTTAYVNYALVDNNKNGNYSANTASAGSGDNFAAVAGKDNSAFAVGIIHKF
jgi:predicted porin